MSTSPLAVSTRQTCARAAIAHQMSKSLLRCTSSRTAPSAEPPDMIIKEGKLPDSAFWNEVRYVIVEGNN